MSKTLYIILGPTACGKTTFAIQLAKKLNTQIVSADSRQVFKQMDIGVARPTKDELSQVKHHMIAIWDIWQKYNVALYCQEALDIINQIFKTQDNAILCGGSGLYIDSIINGIDNMPDTPEELKDELNKEFNLYGIEPLKLELQQKDINYYNNIDLNNPRRIIRALAVIRMTNKPFSSFLKKQDSPKHDFDIKYIGLQRNRDNLIDRINSRVDNMVKQGLEKEVFGLLPYKDLPALSTVGYRELFDYFDKKTTLSQAIELIKIHTRQYAKRQMTWFRKNKDIQWLSLQ